MSNHGANIVQFQQAENASDPMRGLPATRLAVRALLDDATAEAPEPNSGRRHQNGIWQRASLVLCVTSSYGLILTQGWSGNADIVPACLHFGLMAAALICMAVANRKAHRR